MRIVTERLWIDPLREEDALFFHELLNSPGWLQFIGDRQVTDEDSARAYIRQKLACKGYHCSVCRLKASGRSIGTVSFIYREGHAYPDVGYALLPEAEKQGYALEAVQQYLTCMVHEMRPDKVIAIVMPGNTRSVRLLEKLGFSFGKSYMEDRTELAIYERVVSDSVGKQ